MAETALSGVKILVTRPRDQASHLVHEIEQAGGIAMLFPLLEITPVQVSRSQVADVELADLMVFISPNAVKYGMAAIADRLPARIATVGQGSAKALRDMGVEDVIVPTERFDSEGLLAMPGLQNVAGWRVKIFRGDGGRDLLGDTLTSRGAAVEYVSCYLRSKPPLDVRELSQADVYTVTSSEALGYLWEVLPQGLSGVPLFVPHPRIAELARLQGWTDVHLTGSGDEGMLSGLMEWARCRMRDAGCGNEEP